MNCSICECEDEVKHLDLYVFGSEGVCLCLNCRITITELLRKMSNMASRIKFEAFKTSKG